MKTMSFMFENMKHVTAKGIIDPDDFYSVFLEKNLITFQGRYSANKLSSYEGLWSFDINGCNGFFEAQTEIEGVQIKIVLT
jgi:hypothetical protein